MKNAIELPISSWIKRVSKGDRVSILAYNSHEFIEIYLAAAKIGAIFVPLNWRMALDEIVRILNDCSPKFFFFSEELSDTDLNLRDCGENLKFFITLGKEGDPRLFRYEDLITYSFREPFPPEIIKFNDPRIILYTSGTTGNTKGALLSNKKTFYIALNANIFFKQIPNDVCLVSRPLFHSGGLLINATPTFYKGATIVFKRRFDTQKYLETIKKYRVTIADQRLHF
jgi:fatty-acyl-CoA synthase